MVSQEAFTFDYFLNLGPHVLPYNFVSSCWTSPGLLECFGRKWPGYMQTACSEVTSRQVPPVLFPNGALRIVEPTPVVHEGMSGEVPQLDSLVEAEGYVSPMKALALIDNANIQVLREECLIDELYIQRPIEPWHAFLRLGSRRMGAFSLPRVP